MTPRATTTRLLAKSQDRTLKGSMRDDRTQENGTKEGRQRMDRTGHLKSMTDQRTNRIKLHTLTGNWIITVDSQRIIDRRK